MRHFEKMLSVIITASAFLLCCNTVQARRGSRNVSPDGRFSFQLESYGRSLPTYQHRGYTYVEGRLGDNYSIRVFNHTAGRVEAVVTVDGRDVVSGRQGSYRTARGYVIQGYGSVLIEGFRTSMSDVAAFHFTDVEDSYAARMGDATNVGVIGVAIFEERSWRPMPLVRRQSLNGVGTGYGPAQSQAKSNASGGAPESKAARQGALSAGSADSMEWDDGYMPERSQEMGTGYGESTYSPASETSFVRRSSQRPDASLAIYYDDRMGLIARGVLPRPYPEPYVPDFEPNPFPGSPDSRFAPPPPRY
jgi:hypothetical protein